MSQLALIVPLGGRGGGRPDNTLPGGGGHPDNSLPIGGGAPGTPDQGLPLPPVGPDNTLPETPTTPIPPPQVALPIVLPPGTTKPVEPARYFELKYTVRFGWVLVPVPKAEPK